jgi:hypothetical protein
MTDYSKRSTPYAQPQTTYSAATKQNPTSYSTYRGTTRTTIVTQEIAAWKSTYDIQTEHIAGR